MLERIRAFIAVPVTDEIRTLVGQLEQDLKSTAADVKWVEPQNLHITLKFLGTMGIEE